MASKKQLLSCEAKDFVAAMNPKKEAIRKTSPRMRSCKAHHVRSWT